jgi:alpha-glucoside transport system permease protein
MALQELDRYDEEARRVGRSSLLFVVGLLVGLAVLALALVFLADRDGAQNLLADIYSALGNSSGAQELRQGQGDQFVAKVLMAVIAIVVGVGGIWLVYAGANAVIELLGPKWRTRLIPWLFVGPALILLVIFLVWPLVRTIWSSLTLDGGFSANYGVIAEDPSMLTVLRNNLLWLVVATAGSVGIGLLIAGLVDRVKREALAKTFIFLPLAISLVGASVIWGFVYAWAPPGQPQYGLLNAIWTGLGQEPVAWVQANPPMNTLFLIVIMIWLQTGFAMVVLSAAIKGVSIEIIEAAQLDGASERQVFFRVIVPNITGSILVVAVTIAIAVMKIFDIVWVMTGGRFETDVVANRMFVEMFMFFREGRASALAVLLFIAVIPIMVVNIRRIRRQGIGA